MISEIAKNKIIDLFNDLIDGISNSANELTLDGIFAKSKPCWRLSKAAQIWRGLNILAAGGTKGTFVPLVLCRNGMCRQIRTADLFG